MPKTITRSRNGCAVCKSKRLKCDETKPSCSRCVRLGIACPGYLKPLKWPTRSRARKGNSDASGSPPSAGSSEQSYTFEPSHQTDQSVSFCSSSSVDQGANIVTPNNYAVGLDSSFTPLPFDEHPDVNLQPKTPKTASLANQGYGDNELWLAEILAANPQFNSPVAVGFPSPVHCAMPLAQPLQDHTSILVEYYFKEVCGMMSCYDSQLNPYRTTISDFWSSSPSLYYVTQSMAAACLSEVSPKFTSIGHRLRDQAASCLSKEIEASQIETSSLMALVMLGMSRSWHSPGDVGQSEFEMLAKIVLSSKSGQSGIALADEEKRQFFYNSLVYWQVLLAFVVDRGSTIQDIKPTQPKPIQPDGLELHAPHIPHPQTGVGIEVEMLVGKVGSLVRRERKRIQSRRFASRNDINQAQTAILEAEQLQAQLCALQLPLESTIVDSGDDMSPADHLVRIAEAYRCTGLLQLYRNFPDLLIPYTSMYDPTQQFTTFGSTQSTSLNDNRPMESASLIYLALHILDLVESVPVTSTSRSIQPFLLVSICSELNLDRSACSMAGSQRLPLTSLASSPRLRAPVTEIDILRARKSITSRLLSFESMLAAKPIQQMLQLVKETWAWMENSGDVYWMDVMMAKGYEVLMG
ncbi:hypothetical protein ASPVEDRAFT_136312 [Aspergillus versicolor CBS 583.65]|uniref:Zn(2)-C6 fungal-type domain-containing protein n=1 Tax=Aspergillus versicolor CBS 583.65 TaxID=1036611 RepID=A0A1L9PQT2_ASPVE|nr:uncharacterized protein ASPVEDRAFT_136312 [Aspergillus versicolor CBS 583.65]OJJ03863.1 hypothetical protein ASPVEDRAFT_136312 [Aspergillus versicolor CBS 583.65]